MGTVQSASGVQNNAEMYIDTTQHGRNSNNKKDLKQQEIELERERNEKEKKHEEDLDTAQVYLQAIKNVLEALQNSSDNLVQAQTEKEGLELAQVNVLRETDKVNEAKIKLENAADQQDQLEVLLMSAKNKLNDKKNDMVKAKNAVNNQKTHQKTHQNILGKKPKINKTLKSELEKDLKRVENMVNVLQDCMKIRETMEKKRQKLDPNYWKHSQQDADRIKEGNNLIEESNTLLIKNIEKSEKEKDIKIKEAKILEAQTKKEKMIQGAKKEFQEAKKEANKVLEGLLPGKTMSKKDKESAIVFLQALIADTYHSTETNKSFIIECASNIIETLSNSDKLLIMGDNNELRLIFGRLEPYFLAFCRQHRYSRAGDNLVKKIKEEINVGFQPLSPDVKSFILDANIDFVVKKLIKVNPLFYASYKKLICEKTIGSLYIFLRAFYRYNIYGLEYLNSKDVVINILSVFHTLDKSIQWEYEKKQYTLANLNTEFEKYKKDIHEGRKTEKQINKILANQEEYSKNRKIRKAIKEERQKLERDQQKWERDHWKHSQQDADRIKEGNNLTAEHNILLIDWEDHRDADEKISTAPPRINTTNTASKQLSSGPVELPPASYHPETIRPLYSASTSGLTEPSSSRSPFLSVPSSSGEASYATPSSQIVIEKVEQSASEQSNEYNPTGQDNPINRHHQTDQQTQLGPNFGTNRQNPTGQDNPINRHHQTDQQTQQDDEMQDELQDDLTITMTTKEFLDDVIDKKEVWTAVKYSVSQLAKQKEVKILKKELSLLLKKFKRFFKEKPIKSKIKSYQSREIMKQTRHQNQWFSSTSILFEYILQNVDVSAPNLQITPLKNVLHLKSSERNAINHTLSALVKDLDQQSKAIIKADRERKREEERAKRQANQLAQKEESGVKVGKRRLNPVTVG